jgi:hypothetical protein
MRDRALASLFAGRVAPAQAPALVLVRARDPVEISPRPAGTVTARS